MNVDSRTQPRDVQASDPDRSTTPVVRVIAASLAAGLAAALVLVLAVFPGDTEGVITGSFLCGFGVGWAALAILTTRFTRQPQRWAAVPAAAMTTTGVALIATSPGDGALRTLTWVWPPALLALVVWMFGQMRRALTGRGRWLLTPIFVVLAASSLGGVVQNLAGPDLDAYPAAGKVYSVGDHRLHLDCRGQNGPTVVLFNGLSEISTSWARISDQLTSTTRVCAYDRAGQAWSDDAAPQDGVAAAADLHRLLAQAGERGPFVLVGHSTGGAYALTYASQYPDQVAGMVLLDSSSPRQFTAVPSYELQYAMLRRALAVAPMLARMGLGGLFATDSHLPAEAADRVRAVTATVRAARNARDEISVVPRVFEQAQALATLGNRPLAVLTASEQLETDGWAAAQDQLAELSTNQVHRIVTSTHEGLLEDPRAASQSARAITDVVTAVRAGTAPTS